MIVPASIDTALVGFLSSLANGDPPPTEARAAVAQHTLEIFACLLAGADIPEVQPVLRTHARVHGEVSIPPTDVRSELALAAGATAALSHAAELDPIHAHTVICPAAVTIPAALAVAQTFELSGPRYIAAVCAGYEAAIRLGRALDGAELLAAGWWPTAVCGSFAAAATSAICLGLAGEPLQDALALAAIHSGGLAIGGPTTAAARNLLCAHTVRVGVDAALAARSGISGPRALFSEARSLFTAFAGGRDAILREAGAASLTPGPGDPWAILETSLKRWPCALQTQSALDALACLASQGVTADEVQSVKISLPAAMRRIVDRPDVPTTQWGAAASLQFLAASLLLDGDILDQRLGAAGRCDPAVHALMQRVHVVGDASLDGRYPREWPARVTLRTSHGEMQAECAQPPGHPARPLPFESSEARLRVRAAQHRCSEDADLALTFMRSLDTQHDMGAVVRTLRLRDRT